MNKKASLTLKLAVFFCIAASTVLFTGCNDDNDSGSPSTPTPSAPNAYPDNLPGNVKNIILMIPDGISHESMKVVDYYMNGEAESQIYNDFPVQVAVETSEYEYIYDITYNTANPPAPTGYTITGYIYLGYDPEEAYSDFYNMIWRDPMVYPTATDQDAYLNHTTDSASASTAMATGYKTKDGAMSYGVKANTAVGNTAAATDFVSLTNITQIARQLGKAAGVVTTVPLSHATPGAQVAHNIDRNQYSAIADEMILNSGLEVIMGAGGRDYNYNGDPNTQAPNRMSTATFNTVMGWYNNPTTIPAGGFNVIRSRTEFQNLATTTTPPARVLGIPNVMETLNYYAGSPVTTAIPKTKYTDSYYVPYSIPRVATVPTLAEMANGALNVLKQDTDGFYLMIEGGAVDWADHFGILYRANEATRLANGETPGPWGILIEEMDDFNKAVEAVHAWVEANSNWDETLLIVVPDHDTGFVWGAGSGQINGTAVFNEVINNGQGVLPGFNWYSWWHSNKLVPLYAKGAGADRFTDYIKGTDPRYGEYINNIDIFKVMHYSILKNKLAGLISWARMHNIDYGTMISRLLVADQALDNRNLPRATQFLEDFVDAVNDDTSLSTSGMAETAEDIIDAIEPHVSNAGW